MQNVFCLKSCYIYLASEASLTSHFNCVCVCGNYYLYISDWQMCLCYGNVHAQTSNKVIQRSLCSFAVIAVVEVAYISGEVSCHRETSFTLVSEMELLSTGVYQFDGWLEVRKNRDPYCRLCQFTAQWLHHYSWWDRVGVWVIEAGNKLNQLYCEVLIRNWIEKKREVFL